MQTKITGALMLGALALLVLPIMNLAETTRVEGAVNDLLTLSNEHLFSDREKVQGMLTDAVLELVGEEANPEVILYHYRGTVPAAAVADPSRVPSTAGIKKTPGYFEVSALVARAYWVQTKTIGSVRDADGRPIGKCYFCSDDQMIQRVLFVRPEAIGTAFGSPPGDLDFVQNPEILFE